MDHLGYYKTEETAGGPVMTQPQSTTQNVVVVTQSPGQVVIPPGHWTTDLCGCFEDITSCLAAFFCLPCYRCYLADKMNEHCCMPLCLTAGADLMVLRMKMRTMKNIPGGAISDCCAVTWCTCCVAAQLSREWDNSYMNRQ
ncbi:placenta-specific gene 8 protein-like [Ptychodera flava]|uniref:placenta-specific gene 8 protein-like n=1 Tax=Ptychodera flava TaxID=63121 RepID=UPI003969DADD